MNKILFIDTLATGLNPERCAIYRIGGIICEETSGCILEKAKFDLLVRPFEGARILENSLWVGGTTRSMLIRYPDHREAFKEFLKIISGNIDLRDPKDKLYIAGFNVSSFDVPLIRNWFNKNENDRFRDCFFVQAIDLMSLAAFALMEDRVSMPDFHLETAAKYLDIIPSKEERYSCIDNAATCLEMYKTLKNRFHTGDITTHDRLESIYTNYADADRTDSDGIRKNQL